MTVPTFLVIGAGRSGTTALVEGLRARRDVYVTHPKEPHFFGLHGMTPAFNGPGDEATINSLAVTNRDQYLALFPARHTYTALGDGSVSTLYYYEHAIPEIKAVCPQARFVVLLREPVARAYSAFQYMSARGFEPVANFLDAIADEDRRVKMGWHHLWHYTRMSRYAESVAAFQSAFGPDRVGIWFYDHMEADYMGLVDEVLRFIGVSAADHQGADVPVVNRSGIPRSRLVQSGIQAATRTEWVRRSVKRFTTFEMRERVRDRLLRRSGVSAADAAVLQPVFAEDLTRLARLIPTDRAPSWLSERSPQTDA